jgi:hypothetical protein
MENKKEKIIEELGKWLEEEDRKNWEIERYFESALLLQRQEIAEKVRGINLFTGNYGKSGNDVLKEIIKIIEEV